MAAAFPEVIGMDASSRTESYYRIRIGSRVKYAVVAAGSLTSDEIDLPLYHFPSIPWDLDTWNIAHLSRSTPDEPLEATLTKQDLPSGRELWHPEVISCLSLERTMAFNMMTYECTPAKDEDGEQESSTDSQTSKMVAKIARFEWEIPYIEQETRVYRLLEGRGIAPRFLGHLHENGRVMGLLLEKIEGRFAGIEDLDKCKEAMSRLHKLGLLHGDVNRYNFIVTGDDRVYLIDFTTSRETDDAELMTQEMERIADMLKDESRLGAPLGAYDDDYYFIDEGEDETQNELENGTTN